MTVQTRDLQTALIVEDHPLFSDALAMTLRAVAGIAAVTTADCLEAALTRLDQGAVPDVVVLDLNLPGESGMSFAARLRARSPEAGIIVLTVRSGTEVRTQGYDTGVDIYLQKPCDRREILAAIKSMMRRISAPVPPPRGMMVRPASKQPRTRWPISSSVSG